MSALTVIQDACDELGIAAPSAAFASTNQQVIQLCGLANREGKDLYKKHQWQRITAQQTFTTLAQETQTLAIPADFDRFVNDSMWNRSIARKVYGPMTEQQYQMYAAFPIFTAVNPAFIIRGNAYIMQPAPSAGNTIAYSYVKKYWCTDSGGTGQTALTADTDIILLPEDLVTLGIIWRFKKSKGFDYAEDFRTYEKQIAIKMGSDGGAPKMNLTYGLNRWQPYPFNIPEGNWP